MAISQKSNQKSNISRLVPQKDNEEIDNPKV